METLIVAAIIGILGFSLGILIGDVTRKQDRLEYEEKLRRLSYELQSAHLQNSILDRQNNILRRMYEGANTRQQQRASTASTDARGWRKVFGFPNNFYHPTKEELKAAYRKQAMQAHPDRGGSSAMMSALNTAKEAAEKELGYA